MKSCTFRARLFLAACVITGTGFPGAHAAPILQPAAATTGMGWTTTYEPVHAVDQSGLSVNYVSGVTDFDSYVASATTFTGASSNNMWFSAAGNITGTFDFDLGGSFDIQSFALWADPQSAGQGVMGFNLLADDNASFSSATLLGSYSAVDGLGDPGNLAQVFGFTPTTASYVRMEILSNNGSATYTGISEAAFELVAVPLPAAVWLFGSGLLALIGIGRQRRQS